MTVRAGTLTRYAGLGWVGGRFLGDRMSDDLLEQDLLTALSGGRLTRDKLASAVGVPEHAVGRVLGGLMRDGQVVKVPHSGGRPKYQLTPHGAGRVHLVNQAMSGESVGFGEFVDVVTAGHAEAKAAAYRQKMARLRLTDEDRTTCSTALGEQYGLGRIDMSELKRRTDLLYAATTRADLTEVFDGLPEPFDLTPQTAGKSPWRWVVFGLAAGVSVPFFLFGVLLFTGPFEVDDTVAGVIFSGGALLWSFLAWSWAARRRRGPDRGRTARLK